MFPPPKGPNSHSQIFVHSHTIASSNYMILSTQHRVHKPENLDHQNISSQMKEIPYYVGYGYTNGRGPSLVHVELSQWLLEVSLVSEISIPKIVCFVTIFGLR